MPWWAICLTILAGMALATVGTVWVAFMWKLITSIRDEF